MATVDVKTATLLILGLWPAGGTCAYAEEAGEFPRPNILLIVAEDLSSRVGAFGDLVAQTPAIDALATQASAMTMCSPHRVCVHPAAPR